MDEKVTMYKEKYMEYLSHKTPTEQHARSKSLKGKTLKK